MPVRTPAHVSVAAPRPRPQVERESVANRVLAHCVPRLMEHYVSMDAELADLRQRVANGTANGNSKQSHASKVPPPSCLAGLRPSRHC